MRYALSVWEESETGERKEVTRLHFDDEKKYQVNRRRWIDYYIGLDNVQVFITVANGNTFEGPGSSCIIRAAYL